MTDKLHIVIADVLKASKESLSVKQIAEIIKSKQLWRRLKDNTFPPTNQIGARIDDHPDLFTREKGMIKLRLEHVNEKRIARLCWNDNGWVYPSGHKGKSQDKDSHEGKFGFGHEEWLFDIGKILNGFHYGFLEPVRKQQQAYSGNTYDIWLYANRW